MLTELADRIEGLAGDVEAGRLPWRAIADRLRELAAVARAEGRARQQSVDRSQVAVMTAGLACLHLDEAVGLLLPLRPADCAAAAGCPHRRPWDDEAAEAEARERARAGRDEAERLMAEG